MLKKKFCVIMVISFATMLFGCNINPHEKQQEALAEQIGVEIDDFPYPLSFPVNYFNELLKPGMSPGEVHNIVIGYEKVYSCGRYSEIYYYFGKDDNKALRFEVYYDKETKYKKIQGEDDDSRYIRTKNCILGETIGE